MRASRHWFATIAVGVGGLAAVYGGRYATGQAADTDTTARSARGLMARVKTAEDFVIPVGTILAFAG